jgi:hypothetical protein
MAANRPKRRRLISTPKGSYGYICEEFNILTAGHNLRQWAGTFKRAHFMGCPNHSTSWMRHARQMRDEEIGENSHVGAAPRKR